MRVVLTGGGTGGHAYPAISIGKALTKEFPNVEILFIGSRNSIEERIAKEQGFSFAGVSSRKLRKLVSPDTVLTVLTLGKGFIQAHAIFRKFKPDIVIGTGGYTSAAVVLAQQFRKGLTIVHEGDVVPGRTNLMLSRRATRICLAFEGASEWFPASKINVTGLAIRSDFRNKPPDKKQAKFEMGLDPGMFTILVLGGSQGAKRLNDVVSEALPELEKLPVQVLHQVGERNIAEVEEKRKSFSWNRYHVRAYFDNIIQAYAASDFAMCRCGTSTLSEITAVGLPALLVPYPYAHADHQRRNAEFIEQNGGGILIGEADLNGEIFAQMVRKYLESPNDLKKMAEASRALGKPDAAKKIARIAAELILKK